MIMSPLIKPGLSKLTPSMLWPCEEPSEVYLIGKGYFRHWTLNFNEKSLKESNYRNIERAVATQKILRLFWLHSGKQLAVLT
jgi:hypothetical protein